MHLTVYKGRDGTITIPVEVDTAGGTNYVSFPLDSSVVEFRAGRKFIDSTGPNVQTSGNEATFKLGSLDLNENVYQASLIIYNTDYPLGKLIAGPGLAETIEMDFRVE